MGKHRERNCVLVFIILIWLGFSPLSWGEGSLSLIMNEPDATVLIDEQSIKPAAGAGTLRTEFAYFYYTYDPHPFFVPGRNLVYTPFVRITESVDCQKWDSRKLLKYQPYEPFGMVPVENAVQPSTPLLPPRAERILDYACHPLQGRQRLGPETYDSFFEFGSKAAKIRQQALQQILEPEEIPHPKPVETNEGMTVEMCSTPETRAEAAKRFPLQSIAHWHEMPQKWQEEVPLQMASRACANLLALNGKDPLAEVQSAWPTTYWRLPYPAACSNISCKQDFRIQAPENQQVCSWHHAEPGSERHTDIFPSGFSSGDEKHPPFTTLIVRSNIEAGGPESSVASQSKPHLWVSYVSSNMTLEERERRGCALEKPRPIPARSPSPNTSGELPYTRPDIRISTGPSMSDYRVILRSLPGKQARVGYNLEFFEPDVYSKWRTMEVNPLLTLNDKVSSYTFGGYQEGARCWRFHLEYFDGKEWQPYSHQTPCEF